MVASTSVAAVYVVDLSHSIFTTLMRYFDEVFTLPKMATEEEREIYLENPHHLTLTRKFMALPINYM